ncbi:MAG: hypothetical protein M3447_10410 [Acidobacteriota bacterium]|nr:hypothetical protein [Acidobacteriota bacterium]
MSTSHPSELATLERRLELAEIDALSRQQFYVFARRDAVAALVRQRDFDFCCDEGLLNRVDDEDLENEILGGVMRTRRIFQVAKETFFRAEEEVFELRKTLRTLKRTPKVKAAVDQGVDSEGGHHTSD